LFFWFWGGFEAERRRRVEPSSERIQWMKQRPRPVKNSANSRKIYKKTVKYSKIF